MIEDNRPAVLIAEDEEINRTILREILKDKYRVLEAENGHQAVYCIEAWETDLSLVILDIHMPKLDGFGVIDYLARNGLSERVPVIITTSDKSTDVLLQGKQNKVVDIIYKPFRASEIRKKVDMIVEVCKYENNLDAIIADTSVYLSNQYETVRKARAFHHVRWEENVRVFMDKMLPDNVDHNGRIRAYTEIMLTKIQENYPKYGLTKSSIKCILDATVLHDIGKVIIPDSVFDKDDVTAHRGLMQLKRRPEAACEMINLLFGKSSHQTERKYAYDICRNMFELFDGKGYPECLCGNEIPICAQVVGLVHKYDELRFPLLGNTITHKEAFRKILEADFRSYNPDLLEVLEELSDDIEAIAKGKSLA